MTKTEKLFHIALIILALFILGVQIGIANGRRLQIEDMRIENDHICSN